MEVLDSISDSFEGITDSVSVDFDLPSPDMPSFDGSLAEITPTWSLADQTAFEGATVTMAPYIATEFGSAPEASGFLELAPATNALTEAVTREDFFSEGVSINSLSFVEDSATTVEEKSPTLETLLSLTEQIGLYVIPVTSEDDEITDLLLRPYTLTELQPKLAAQDEKDPSLEYALRWATAAQSRNALDIFSLIQAAERIEVAMKFVYEEPSEDGVQVEVKPSDVRPVGDFTHYQPWTGEDAGKDVFVVRYTGSPGQLNPKLDRTSGELGYEVDTHRLIEQYGEHRYYFEEFPEDEAA